MKKTRYSEEQIAFALRRGDLEDVGEIRRLKREEKNRSKDRTKLSITYKSARAT